MNRYVLEEVTTSQLQNEFNNLPKRLYRGNPYWVCPLDNDINAVFDRSRNKLFNGGDAVRWILRDQTGKVLGRIAAFYNREQAAIEEQPTGGCGFFESIDDQNVANTLFEAAKMWLTARGMEAMDGPVNFGSRDEWWGLLTDGFEFQPLYTNPYNPPYYKALFENWGFKVWFNQHTYKRGVEVENRRHLNDAVYDRVKRLEETPGYRFEHIRKEDLQDLPENFRMVYNKAWAKFTGVKPFSKEDTQKLFNTLSPIIDINLIYFAYFNDEPVGFFVMVPDLNRVIGRFNGKMNTINKLRLFAMLKMKKIDRIFAIIFGVTPEFQGRGIESGIMHAFEKEVIKGTCRQYNSMELAWVGDFNPVMMRMVESYVQAHRHKMHTTYRVLFDPNKEFHRCPRMSTRR